MHDAETYTSGHTGFIGTYYKSGVLKKTDYPTCPGFQCGGEGLTAFRAASVHTSPDAYGWRSPTSYAAFRHTEDRPVCNYKKVASTTTEARQFVSAITAPLPASESLLDQLQAEAETLCLKKFATGAVDLSVAFLERKQTANMVTDWCRATTRLLRDLKKGRWVTHYKNRTTKTWRWDKSVPRGWTPEALRQWRAGEPVTAVKNAWLTTRYGIAPSIMDISGAVEALSKADNGTFERYIATNHSRRFAVESGKSSLSNYFGRYYVIPVNRETLTFRKHEVHVRMDATIDESFYLTLQDVGVTNPALTAWEVTPYSFVLDWVIGVGDFLSAINAWNTGYKFKAGSVTRYYDLSKKELVSVVSPLPIGTASIQLSYPYPARHHKTGFTRGVYTTPPVPSIVVKRDPLNFERMWDSIFLLSNVLGNGKAAAKAKGRMRGLRI